MVNKKSKYAKPEVVVWKSFVSIAVAISFYSLISNNFSLIISLLPGMMISVIHYRMAEEYAHKDVFWKYYLGIFIVPVFAYIYIRGVGASVALLYIGSIAMNTLSMLIIYINKVLLG